MGLFVTLINSFGGRTDKPLSFRDIGSARPHITNKTLARLLKEADAFPPLIIFNIFRLSLGVVYNELCHATK